jgi:hypothetical protein
VARTQSPSTLPGQVSVGVRTGRSLFWLGLLTTQRAADGRRFRGARLSGWFVALSGVMSVALAVWIGAGDVADLLSLRVLAYAAWLYALLGLPALLHPDFSARTVSELSRLRGIAEIGPTARGLGLFARLGSGLLLAALPGICLAAFLSETVSLLSLRVLLVVLSVLYLLLLAASLATVGVLAERVMPRAPRRTALALIIVPYLLGLAFPHVPSVPGAFFWAFERLMLVGGYLA